MYKHLKPYERPQYYIGETFYGYYPFLRQSRDSDSCERSNFRVGLARLGGESETVIVQRASHFLVGWVETIYIAEADTEKCELADAMLGEIEDYPILDESDMSDLEWDEACETWEALSLRERIEQLQRAYPDEPLAFLAARFDFGDMIHDHDPDGRLFERLCMN